MATNPNDKSKQKPATPPPAPKAEASKPANGAPAPKGEGETGKGEGKKKRARVRLVSTTVPGMWCRMYVDVMEKHGVPKDANGVDMVPGKASNGLSAEEKEARQKAKDAEKAKFDAMTPDEKLAFAKDKREKKAAEKLAKKKQERDALIESIKADLAAGRDPSARPVA